MIYSYIIYLKIGNKYFKSPKGNVTFKPTYYFDIVVHSSVINKIAFYADNADLNLGCDVNLSADQKIELADFTKKLVDISKCYAIDVMGVPIVLVVNTKLVAKLTADVNAALNINTGFTDDYKITLGAVYENKTWTGKYGLTPTFTPKPVDMSGTVQLSQNLTISPEVSVKLYGVAGPYCTPALFEQFDANVASPSLDWDALLKVGVNTTVGADITIFGKTLGNYSKTYNVEKELWSAPDTILKISGDNQAAMENQALAQPVKVKVTDNLNNPLKNVFAYFIVTQGGGSVSKPSVITDADGYAASYWTLGAAGTQEVSVQVKKADGSGITATPVTFTSKAKSSSIAKYSGDSQTGELGKALANPVKVIVSDDDGAPVAGAIVKFTANNGGSVSQSQATTGTDGIASVTWTLGSIEKTQTVIVSCFRSDGITPIQGSPLTFTANTATCNCSTFMVGGYEAVQIGTQVWMAKNLDIVTADSWVYPGAGPEYGRLYTWDAAMKACPAGWHIPSDAEWTTLTNYLGGENVAGGKLEESGTSHWVRAIMTGATNSSCFTALPGGSRISSGGFTFTDFGLVGSWWSSTERFTNYAWDRDMYINGIAKYDSHKSDGLSVRCLRD